MYAWSRSARTAPATTATPAATLGSLFFSCQLFVPRRFRGTPYELSWILRVSPAAVVALMCMYDATLPGKVPCFMFTDQPFGRTYSSIEHVLYCLIGSMHVRTFTTQMINAVVLHMHGSCTLIRINWRSCTCMHDGFSGRDVCTLREKWPRRAGPEEEAFAAAAMIGKSPLVCCSPWLNLEASMGVVSACLHRLLAAMCLVRQYLFFWFANIYLRSPTASTK